MLAATSTTQREAVKGMISPRCYSETECSVSSWVLLLLATRTLVNSAERYACNPFATT
jgi:hypothetical protein